MRYRIVISEEKENIAPRGFAKAIKKAMKTALKAEGVRAKCEVNVLITDNEGIHRINREFRDVDRPTDVLSFPMFEFEAENFDADMAMADPETGRIVLGDMAVSVDKIQEQAKEYGNSDLYELSYLTVHSCLHLLGYDHLDEGEQKKQMRRREKEIMNILKVK